MTVLVTGATGMLGSHVVRALLERGERLVALTARGNLRLLGTLREEVRIERECLRILALYEPVASDLRRLATIMKVSRR